MHHLLLDGTDTYFGIENDDLTCRSSILGRATPNITRPIGTNEKQALDRSFVSLESLDILEGLPNVCVCVCVCVCVHLLRQDAHCFVAIVVTDSYLAIPNSNILSTTPNFTTIKNKIKNRLRVRFEAGQLLRMLLLCR
jgi:hypothetical protein